MNSKIKNILGLAIVITLLSVTAVMWLSLKVAVDNSGETAYRTFSVSGEGEVTAVPDVAQFTYTIIDEGSDDLAVLQESNTNTDNSIIEFLEAEGIEKKDIETQSYDVFPQYSRNVCEPGQECDPEEIVGYTVNKRVSVKVREVENAGTVLAGVVELGVDSVSRLDFVFDDDKDLRAEARRNAIEEARIKAEAMAEAGDFKLGKLISINENGYYGRDFAVSEMAMMEADESVALPTAAPVAVEAGEEEITVTVNLTYQIK